MAQITNYTNNSSEYPAAIQNAPICQLFQLSFNMFFEVLKYLEPSKVNTVCSLTCKQIKTIESNLNYNQSWGNLFRLHFPNEKINDNENCLLSYKDKLFIRSNITNGIYSSSSLKDFDPGLSFIISADDEGRLLFTTKLTFPRPDNIKIYDTVSKTCIGTLPVTHNYAINALAASNGKLYVGYSIGTIEVLNMTTGRSLNTIEPHHRTTGVKSLTIIRKDLIAAYNQHIEILDIEKIEMRDIEYRGTTLQINDRFVSSSLITPDGKHVLGNSEGELTIKDLMSRESIATLKVNNLAIASKVNSPAIHSLACANGMLYVGLASGEILIIDLRSLQPVTLIKRYQSQHDSPNEPPRSLAITNGNLYARYFKGIAKFDFTITQELIFKELLELLMNPDNVGKSTEDVKQNPLKGISRMPKSAKNQIYSEQNRICFEQLREIRVTSLDDLNVICPLFPEIIQELDVPQYHYRSREELLSISTANRQNLFNRYTQMLDAITAMDLEAQDCGIIPYGGDGRFSDFKEQLNKFYARFTGKKNLQPALISQDRPRVGDTNDALGNQSEMDLPLTMELNNLIKKFQEIENRHRIAKLRAYIHQEAILQVWVNPKLKDIPSLSAFQKKYNFPLEKLLNMKKFIEKIYT